MRRPLAVTAVTVVSVVALTFTVALGACGGSSSPNPATATTFAVDTQVTDGFQAMVSAANRATAGLGEAGAAADATASAWNGIRARVAEREPALADQIGRAVDALQRGAAAHDAVAIADAAATIARDAARYTGLYP